MGSRPALGGTVSDIILTETEHQISPGETACFPFVARTAYGVPSIHEFNVVSANPNFSQDWIRFARPAGDSYDLDYILEIRPSNVGHSQYGTYPLRLSWRETETYRQAGGRCTLFIRPCVRAVAEPAVKIWPAGQVGLALENRESTPIDMSVSIGQSGSAWSKEWEFDLPVKDGVFSFSGLFDPPPGHRCGDYELAVGAAGVPLLRRTVHVRRSLILRRLVSNMQASLG